MDIKFKQKAISALIWSSLDRIGQNGVQFVISIILARLLLPEEFGMMAMLTIFIAIAQSFMDSGFGAALIQKQDATYIDECSIFYFNILVGILAAGMLCMVAPWIAGFYNQSLLVPLTYALSLNLIINAFGLIQTTLLTKQINFKTQLKVSILATVVSGVIGVTMALNDFGIWSLVALSLCTNFFRTILLWFFNAWRPSMMFSFASLRCMFAFGSRLLASGLLDTIFRNIYIVIIAKLFSPVDLGFYARAKGLQQLPVSSISSIVSRVTFPVFSSVQDDKPRLKRGVRKALAMLVLFNFPLMVGLAIVAKPLVVVLLTEKWLPCVLYLQLLCIIGMLYPLHVVNLNVLKAQGRSDLFFRLEIIKKILVVVAIASTYRWGIITMIYGQIATSCIAYFLNAYYTGKMLDYPAIEQVRDVAPTLLMVCLMGLGGFVLKYVFVGSLLVLLTVQVVTGVVIYISICYIFQAPSFMEILEMIKSRVSQYRYID